MITGGPVPLQLLPSGASHPGDTLHIAGCDVIELAERFGTPLFVYDEQHLIDRCREAVGAFPGGVAYASKAFLCKAMARLAYDSGMDIDVATGGELFVARAAGVPASRMVLHGNNKSDEELAYAIDEGIGRIVVDSFDEIDRIRSIAPASTPLRVLLRLNPGIEAHTHEYLQTGAIDSKFGFPMVEGIADRAVEAIEQSPSMTLAGFHVHVGSQVFDVASFARAIAAIAPFVAGADVEEVSIGGGLGVAYVDGEESPSIAQWGRVVHDAAADAGITARITAEPGRSIVADSAVTAYTIGTIKDIPGTRTYVAVDGGMSDNPRPVLYGSGYEAFLARAVGAQRPRAVRIVGKHCESGDFIVRDARLPADVGVGDILVTPVTGAYGHSMGSNYNKVPRPAVVFARQGTARVVVERETYRDMVAKDVG